MTRLSTDEREILVITDEHLIVYRWGDKRSSWMRRATRKNPLGGVLTQRFVGALYERQLCLFPRRPHEPEYTVDIPSSLKPTGILALREHPVELAIWTQTGALARLKLPEQQFNRVMVSEVALMHVSRYRDSELLVADAEGRIIQLRTNAIVYQWRDCTAGVNSLTVHPHQPWVLSAGIDGILRLYDLQQRKLRWAAAGHRWEVLAAEFIDEERVLSIGSDRQALLWRIGAQLPSDRCSLPSAETPMLLQRDAQQTLWLATARFVHHLRLDPLSWRTIPLAVPSSSQRKED